MDACLSFAVTRALVDQALARIPDEPRWVDVRGMLLSGRARVVCGPLEDGFLVAVPDASLAAVVGRPPQALIEATASALPGDVNVLAQPEDEPAVAAALDGWRRRTAVLHVLPGVMPWEARADPAARVFTRPTAPALDHLPEALRLELIDALRGRTIARYVPGAVPVNPGVTGRASVPVAAVWDGPVPVAFCYPVWQTDAWWDVSIDTLEAWRRRGFGSRAARALIRHLRQEGRAPVWGALESNAPSRALAAKLGFIEAAGLRVFTRR